MMKPKCLEGDKAHDHHTMQGVDPVFQFYMHTKLNVPNISYYEIIEWLVKELEVKMELDHIFSITEWVFAFQAAMNTSLTSISPVFKAAKRIEGLDVLEAGLDESGMVDEKVPYWRDEEILKADEKTIYVKSYKGSPLCLELSLFKQTGTSEDETKKKEISASPGSKIV